MTDEKELRESEQPIQKKLIRKEDAPVNTPTTAGCSHDCANCPTPCHF